MLAILIVEDDPIIALDLEWTVIDLGHSVCALADSAADAVDAAVKHGPDLVLMDFNLSGNGDGADAARRIRQHSQVPIVFVTGHADTDCRVRMESVVGTRIVSKPHNPQMIADAILAAEAA